MKLDHLAIIMDGNRRWAVHNNLPTYEGHRQGAQNLWRLIKNIEAHNLKYLTVFAFSTENWKRSKKEISFLMTLLDQFLNDLKAKLVENNFKIRFIGDLSSFHKNIKEKLLYINKATAVNEGITITLALNYGGRSDIILGINQILNNKNKPENIKEEDFKSYTSNNNIPDPDLLIRTGGEMRLSNFLLWDLAYTELIFLPDMWPDFNDDLLNRCFKIFSKRVRKYGV